MKVTKEQQLKPCKKAYERRDELLGKEYETNNCGKCFVVDYKSSSDVTVVFYEPLYIAKCNYRDLREGVVGNPLYPRVYGVGSIGVGKYNSRDHKNLYHLWKSLLQRVYTKRNPSYKGVTVCDEWLNFQNFAEWCTTDPFFNTEDENGRKYHLDKDILVKGNKIYSPNTCCFIPQEINSISINVYKARGNYPVGVVKRGKKFLVRIRRSGDLESLGVFSNLDQAFFVYKQAKENYIKSLAEKWKGRIDEKVYESLLTYKVSMDD